MAKFADLYFETHPWKIIEDHLSPEYAQVAESIFSLGNEYMGVRGYFDEGYSGEHLHGSYFNGIYEEAQTAGSAYKGMVSSTQFMVDSVDWLHTRIYLGEEQLDLAKVNFRDYHRELDMKTGLLTRSFIWETASGKEVAITFERLLSMNQVENAVQRITLTALNFDGHLEVVSGLDFSVEHQMRKGRYWDVSDVKMQEHYISAVGTTKTTDQKVFSCCHFIGDFVTQEDVKEPLTLAKRMIFSLKKGEQATLKKFASNLVIGNQLPDEEAMNCMKVTNLKLDYTYMLEENKAFWDHVWKHGDIVIDGDALNQQGIRYCIYQMNQTYHGAVRGTNIGAKGLTGEAYNGNAFWDTEVYCLPYFAFNNLEAAKNLLMFRYDTLDQAKKRARDLDCDGAFYPIATLNGTECCDLWQHASLQLQASTGVAYGIWFYERLSGDVDFVKDYGVTMLVEICRMLATRGDWTHEHTRYGYFSVMGPDEFQMMVNHNYYTNFMARFTFNYTLEVLSHLEEAKGFVTDVVTHKERENWKKMAQAMYIPYDEEQQLYEQHAGFFDLPHVDIHNIPVEDFPLYHHWSYDRIYRNDMIKQPDVLMLMLMFNSEYQEDVLLRNYEYYESRCIHESSLSPSVHSILAAQLKKHEEAYNFFKFTTRMDLDNYNRNSHEGLHITSLAASWMNIVYGFGGMRSDGDILTFNPVIPKAWTGYQFRINYQDAVIVVDVNKDSVRMHTLEDTPVRVMLYGEAIQLTQKDYLATIPTEWRVS